ncbi:glycosyltransferase family 2 protein [Thalassoglobus sp.]|uniref:glycosyltransferase family 2 protein n=1 Tax=Thalassoglobus sp. TaxID=2795869 RepID=UPI003AA9A89E
MLEVTFTTVLYQPDWSRTGAIVRDVLGSLAACSLTGEYLIVDNSPAPTMEAVRLAAEDERVRFLWNQGYNVYLAGALKTAALQAHGRHFVYCCASHGLINDPTWLTDLISPLADESIALAGHVQPCEFNRVASVPADIIEPQIHVQGGVWSARTQFLREFAFSHRFPFEFCDVDLSRRCLAAGYQLASVPSIVSIAGGVIPDPERYKYVHDYR